MYKINSKSHYDDLWSNKFVLSFMLKVLYIKYKI